MHNSIAAGLWRPKHKFTLNLIFPILLFVAFQKEPYSFDIKFKLSSHVFHWGVTSGMWCNAWQINFPNRGSQIFDVNRLWLHKINFISIQIEQIFDVCLWNLIKYQEMTRCFNRKLYKKFFNIFFLFLLISAFF